MVRNQTFIFKSAPEIGSPLTHDHLLVEDRPFDLNCGPPNGGFTMANLFFSLDPGLRLRMVSPHERCYTTPFKEGQVLEAVCISRILKSDWPSFKPGDLVSGPTPTEEYSVVPPERSGLYRIIENPHFLPLTNFLGPLGIPGLTAYSSLFAIAKPQPGETLYVSAAAGGVGQVVGQLAKIAGLTVLGSVGSDEKLEIIQDALCFDHGFNYKKEAAADALQRLAPEGIDIYFDNTGGEALDAALLNMKRNGRIISCGCVSQYNTEQHSKYRIANMFEVPARRLRIERFIVFDEDMLRWSGHHQIQVGQMLANGQMLSIEDITVGMENAIEAFLGVLQGRNVGKAILQVSGPKLKEEYAEI